MIRKTFISAFLLLFFAFSSAQINFGVKGGATFGYDSSLENSISNIKESNGKNSTGWHLGIFTKIGLPKLFIQPEAYYSSMKTEFTSESQGKFSSRSSRLDIPVLVGTNFLKLGRVYAGPVFSTLLDEDISLNNIKINKNDFSIAGQVGVGVEILSLIIDARYEFGISDSDTKFVNKLTNEKFLIDKKANSLVLSIGYKF